MRGRWGRAGAITGLLVAIFGDLGRRAWWAYRAGATEQRPTRTSIVARRPADRATHVPLITPAWQPFVAQALPPQAVAVALTDEGAQLPVVWIDATNRPNVADLPRVLNKGIYTSDPPVLATQWLADLPAHRVALVVSVIEPVTCSWAVSFDLLQSKPILELAAITGELVVALRNPPQAEDNRLPLIPLREIPLSVRLPLASTVQLHAILTEHARGAVAG